LVQPSPTPDAPLESWDPLQLPLWTHEDWQHVTSMLDGCKTNVACEKKAKHHGIKGMPALQRVASINYACGIPWDFMHLLFLNVIKNLFQLWSGSFKGLTVDNNDNFVIPKKVWKKIGNEMENATKTIPSAFIRRLDNIFKDKGEMTAEGWGFWFIYLFLHLLWGRFPDDKYFDHALQLIDIIKTSLQYMIS